MENSLFEDFSKHSAQDWMAQLEKDLKGQPTDSLLWKTGGVKGKPFYTAEDLDFERFDYTHFSQNTALLGDRFWVNYQPVEVVHESEANKEALNALAGGASGILFELSETPDYQVLLKDIELKYCHVAFHFERQNLAQTLVEKYREYLKAKNIPLEETNGFIHGPGAPLLSTGPKLLMAMMNSESDTPLNLALTIGRLIDRVDALTEQGHGVEDCLRQAVLQVRLSNDFFLEIAKLRALRRLFSTVATGYGHESASPTLVAEAGPWTGEEADPHSFLLHATTQAMSAVIGGVDALLVRPFYNVFPSKKSLAQRIARNISTILSEESYLNKMVDPAAGSYYIEHLTEELFHQSFNILQQIEQEGGVSNLNLTSFQPKTSR
ncbi:methylmalonyl-CoA mutase family protein [Roseivirga sp. UBA838]|uniref:methylmalonyl-CoA mutase family protein n=1 Tax=Roseivirga sp. UBA838 TaxID=1947393 RepID=UPI00257E32F2|nr:methylmalonyl-CoA mutase family protein [Roseivirga sp. UBA838]|tara:strand:+ start:76329 stop:77465 length:1137 start_codon:yes stop_codon:yes gene_type:complete